MSSADATMSSAEAHIAEAIKRHAASVCKHTRCLQLARHRLATSIEEYQLTMQKEIIESEKVVTALSLRHGTKKKGAAKSNKPSSAKATKR